MIAKIVSLRLFVVYHPHPHELYKTLRQIREMTKKKQPLKSSLGSVPEVTGSSLLSTPSWASAIFRDQKSSPSVVTLRPVCWLFPCLL